MPDISQLTLPSGSTYDIKDAAARQDIKDIKSSIGSGVRYIGVTTTVIIDGSVVSPIVIEGQSVEPKSGDLVFYLKKEFIWNGSKWTEFGDMGDLKALAFKDSASGSFTPAGQVSKPTFTGTSGQVSVKGTPTGSVVIGSGTGTANYVPEGQVSKPTFTGVKTTYSGMFKPSGTVSQPTFTGETTTSTGNFTPHGSVDIVVGNGEANYTPEGTISAPTVSVVPSTSTVNSITDVGTLPAFTATVANENLTFSWSAGTLPTKGTDTSVVTGITSATASAPSFTGTPVELTGDFVGSQGVVSVTGQPQGSVSAPTFTGIEGSFSVSGTPEGEVSKPSFTGEGVELIGSFVGTEFTSSGSFTPEGSVSKPDFTGTQGTVTVS